MNTSYTFKKDERLSSRKAITSLFEDGKAFTIKPFRVFWKYCDSEISYPAQMAVSVSKRNFKKAVDRNRIKRLIKEAWRYNKHILYKQLKHNNSHIILMLVYTSDSMPTQDLVSMKTEEVVSKLLLILSDKNNKPG